MGNKNKEEFIAFKNAFDVSRLASSRYYHSQWQYGSRIDVRKMYMWLWIFYSSIFRRRSMCALFSISKPGSRHTLLLLLRYSTFMSAYIYVAQELTRCTLWVLHAHTEKWKRYVKCMMCVSARTMSCIHCNMRNNNKNITRARTQRRIMCARDSGFSSDQYTSWNKKSSEKERKKDEGDGEI